MSSNEGVDKFLLEALGLIASYLFSQNVGLEVVPVGLLFSSEKQDAETTSFLHYLEARHSLACGIRLREVLSHIEDRVSRNRTLARTESKGMIRGRLDIPRYTTRRAQCALPRTYHPIIVNQEIPQTPENSLVVRALKGLLRQISRAPFPRTTAEGQASLTLYNWVRTRLRRWPWAEVKRLDSIDRLRTETLQRIHKRQTGNERGYSQLLGWIAEWLVDVDRLGNEDLSRITQGILAFPTDDMFRNKVFEIWCLREIARSFTRCRCDQIGEPRGLHERSEGPIYQFRHHSDRVEVWFQRQPPVGSPRWRYDDTGRPLAGIPDITVTSHSRTPLIVDAKFRNVTTETRAEETYKMLGYFENFRDSIGSGGFQGLLIFVGPDSFEKALIGPEGSHLSLVVVDRDLQSKPVFQEHIDGVIQRWLDVR